jgi:hypothetical protein
MGWLVDWLNETEAASKKPAPVAPLARGPRKPEPEIKEVWFQIRPPQNDDMGMVEPAFYSVSHGVLTMYDAKGKPTGKQFYLGPNDDPGRIAGRLGRAAWLDAEGLNFNRQLHYIGTLDDDA